MENTPYAELKSYSKQYGTGRKKITACDGVTLSFSAGSVTGLLGPNGAGKTTLIKGLCGLLYPTSGTVIVNGEENLNGRIGFVPDTPDLDYSLTVKERCTSAQKYTIFQSSRRNRQFQRLLHIHSFKMFCIKG